MKRKTLSATAKKKAWLYVESRKKQVLLIGPLAVAAGVGLDLAEEFVLELVDQQVLRPITPQEAAYLGLVSGYFVV